MLAPRPFSPFNLVSVYHPDFHHALCTEHPVRSVALKFLATSNSETVLRQHVFSYASVR